jgi:hypothetical protein
MEGVRSAEHPVELDVFGSRHRGRWVVVLTDMIPLVAAW